jgi:hypothetical protein
MSHYLIRQDSKKEWTVSKWEDGKRPEEVYNVSKVARHMECTCMGWIRRSDCKHLQMVREFKPNYSGEFQLVNDLLKELG